MANQFSSFNQTSPLASILHDPPISVASNCIRDCFGPTVQLVADCLQARGGSSTLAQLINTLNKKLQHKFRTEDRKEIIRVSDLRTSASTEAPSPASVRASLLVLIQHDMVSVVRTTGQKKNRTVHSYQFQPDRARLLLRYPRFIEYIKKAMDDTASVLVEELLLEGRLRTVDAVVATVEQMQQLKNAPRSDRYTNRQAVLDSFRRLVGNGYICQVPELDAKWEEEEREFEEDPRPPAKKPRLVVETQADPSVVQLLQSGPYKMLPLDALWKVNIEMFHDSLRAVSLGWLVYERYNHQVQSAGAIVNAALKFSAHKLHAERTKDFNSHSIFSPGNLTRYLPKAVLQIFEKRPGGAIESIYHSLRDLSSCANPPVVFEVQVTDGPENSKFQIRTESLVRYLQDRIVHQVILDSHGEVAARICSILKQNGQLESDSIAESAMVPAKDTREILHRLYRENYINLFNLNQGKQHNPASMFYLWSFCRQKGLSKATDNVATALLNMRLRRQHEAEVGRDWIERAKEAGENDENEYEADKVNYERFCKGLERLDIAALQLDETLMVLKD